MTRPEPNELLKAFRVFLKCWPVPNTERNCASERWLKGKDRKNTKVLGNFKLFNVLHTEYDEL